MTSACDVVPLSEQQSTSRRRCFYFTRGDLPAAEYVERILTNLDAITAVCAEEGPFIYVIHPSRIQRMTF